MESTPLDAVLGLAMEVTIAGQSYKLAPLTLGQFAELEAWARRLPFAELSGQLEAITDRKLRERMEPQLRAAAIAAANDRERIAESMNSLGAVRLMFGMMLRKHHPKADADALLGQCELGEVKRWAEELMGRATGNPPKGGQGRTPAPPTGSESPNP